MYEEKELIDGLKMGEETAFETLVKAHQREIYYMVLKMLGNHDDADEVTQKTFINVYRKIGGFRGKSKLRTWIFRIAMNLAKNQLRERSRYKELPDENLLEDGSPPVTEKLEREEMRKIVSRATTRLPYMQRAVLTLRINEHLPFKEIGDIMGCSVGSAKVNYHHAVKRLREILSQQGV